MMGSHGCCKVGQSDVGLVKGGEGPKGESKRLMSKEGRVVLSLSEKINRDLDSGGVNLLAWLALTMESWVLNGLQRWG